MPRNLSNGFVFKDERSGHWRAAISWQDEDGRQRRMTRNTPVACYPDRVSRKTGKVTRDNRGKGAAEDFLREWRDEEVRKDEELSGTVSCETPVYRYVLDYIDMKESTGNILASTADGYRWYAKHLLGTELGKTPVGQVTARQIQEFERDMVQDGYGGNTVSHTHVLLKTAFIRARRLGDIPSNPFDLVDAPKRPTKPINSLDAQSVRQLNQTLGCVADPFSTAVLLALMTGMRQGEICALRWQDVDRVSRKIRVSHALTRASGTFALSTPKTRSSARTIPYGDELARVLEARARAMHGEREAMGLDWDEGLFVVGSAVTGAWKSPMALGQEWRAFVRVARLVGSQGEPPRFHDLRHTFATMAIGSGVDVKTVSAILGHSNAAMTLNVYADALADSKKAGMDLMGRIMSAGLS